MSMIDAGCIDLISILFTLRHFCFDKSRFLSLRQKWIEPKKYPESPVLVDLNSLNCTSILPIPANADGQIDDSRYELDLCQDA